MTDRFPTREESHFLNCIDDNCEMAYCVQSREYDTLKIKFDALKAENEKLREALWNCKERLEFIENNSIKNACCINCVGIYESQISIRSAKEALAQGKEE